MTNYEYLMQNMTLEEFARDRTTCDECPQGGRDKCDKKCMEHMLAWLKAEHRENEMSDLISRQAAIEALAKFVPYAICDESTESYTNGLTDAYNLICQLPSAQPEQRWIPCSERLPEDYEDVLVWFEYFRYGDYNCLYQTYGIGDYSSEYDSWMINHESGWSKLRVFAWMPLPLSYQGEENG